MTQVRRYRYSRMRARKTRRAWDYFFIIWFAILAILAIVVGYTVVHFVLKFW